MTDVLKLRKREELCRLSDFTEQFTELGRFREFLVVKTCQLLFPLYCSVFPFVVVYFPFYYSCQEVICVLKFLKFSGSYNDFENVVRSILILLSG